MVDRSGSRTACAQVAALLGVVTCGRGACCSQTSRATRGQSREPQIRLSGMTREPNQAVQPGARPSMQDVRSAAAPLDHQHAGSSRRPDFESQFLPRVRLLGASRRRSGDHDLQFAELEVTRLDMLVDVAECPFHNGPQRLRKQLLQATRQCRRPLNRRGGRDDRMRSHEAITGAVCLQCRRQSQR